MGSGSFAFAQTDHIITIPTGAADPNAPYFWSEKSTGITTGEITVFPNDTVTWKNADTETHTITSVTQSGEIDGIFDSGDIDAGDSYSRQFTEIADVYYSSSLYPWMNGVVHVVADPGSVRSLYNVGSGYSDDGLGFDVKYVLDASLETNVDINPDEKTLTFRISGDAQNEQVTLVLPTGLIENPSAVWVDGDVTDFETEDVATGTKLIIPITPDSEEVAIMGSQVIPEFGFLALSILSIGVLTAVFLTRSKFLTV